MLIGVCAIIIIASVVAWNYSPFKNTASHKTSADAAEFTNRIQGYILANIGQPIEGFSAPGYLSSFPELTEADFNNVKTLEGVYVYENGILNFIPKSSRRRSSAEEMITEEGHEMLYKNIRKRIGSTRSLDELTNKVLMGEFSPSSTMFHSLKDKVQEKDFQSGIVDEHLTIDNTLRDIDFCGTTYQVKQIFIDEVDVLQRMSDLLKNSKLSPENKVAREFSLSFCKNTSFSLPKELEIGEISIYAYDLPPEQINEENKTYGIFTPIFFIAVRPSINQIYNVSAYDGTHIPLMGLK
jgi:hypothetical protein